MAAQREPAATTGEQREIPSITVIVPVRDGGRQLHELVDALADQVSASPHFEVIIADDGSRDGAADALAEHEWLRVLKLARRNSYAARNSAAAAARGSMLAFCDADCRPDPDWLVRGYSAATESDAIIAGRVRFAPTLRPTIWAMLDVETFLNQEHAVRQGRAVTANLFVPRELHARLRGFDETLTRNADQDFVQRAVAEGARLRYAADAVVWHPTRDRARDFLGKVWQAHYWYGVRTTRSEGRPRQMRLRSLVPIVQAARSRRHFGKPLSLDVARLDAEGIAAGRIHRVVGPLLIYGVVPYLQIAAQATGWLHARRAGASRSGEVAGR